MVLVFSGLDLVTAFTAVVACVNNIGPGLGAGRAVGQLRQPERLPDLGLHASAMLLGRLELLSVLVLFTPQFWRR